MKRKAASEARKQAMSSSSSVSSQGAERVSVSSAHAHSKVSALSGGAARSLRNRPMRVAHGGPAQSSALSSSGGAMRSTGGWR